MKTVEAENIIWQVINFVNIYITLSMHTIPYPIHLYYNIIVIKNGRNQ